MDTQPAAGWYADPLRRFEHRYWDGTRWTEHVGSNGRQQIDPAVEPAPPAGVQSTTPLVSRGTGWHSPSENPPATPRSGAANKIQKEVANLGLASSTGIPNLKIFDEPVLVINQKGKLVELKTDYAIYDRDGRQLAAVRGKRMSSRLQVVDTNGHPLLELRREASLLSSKITISDASGARIGRIVPSANLNRVDRTFKLQGPNDQPVGEVYVEDRRRRREFNVQDANGTVIARISKTRAGLAKELFTKGDHYVVNFPGPLMDPLRSLSIATALIIDRAFHQQ